MAKRKRIARTPKKAPIPKRTKTRGTAEAETNEEMGGTSSVEEKPELPQESSTLDQPEESQTQTASGDTAPDEPTTDSQEAATNITSEILDVTDTSLVLQDLLANTIGSDDELDPDNPPEEFVFAPIIDDTEIDVTTVDLITPSNSRHTSDNSGDKAKDSTTSLAIEVTTDSSSAIPFLLESKKKKDVGECSRNTPVEIEVIDLDDLPDTPTPTSSYGDDIIEITTPDRSERGESPEIILDRQVVDLTGACDVCESGRHGSDNDAESDIDDITDDALLSLWSRMSKKKKKSHTDKSGTPPGREDPKPDKSPPDKPEEKAEESGSSRSLTCPVCMDDFSTIKEDNRQLMSTSCGHVFCSVCIKAAVKTQKKCPTCRKELTMKKLHPIFL